METCLLPVRVERVVQYKVQLIAKIVELSLREKSQILHVSHLSSSPDIYIFC